VSEALRLLARLALAPLRVLVAILVVIDEIARPLYRPVARWFARLALIRRAEEAIAGLPPYAVLAVLAVPLIGVEPLKVLGFYWMGTGRFVPGLLLLGFAYAASFLVVERIYEAGHAALFRIGWFAAIMGFVIRIRDAVLAWARDTALWRAAKRIAAGVRSFRVAAVMRVRRLLGRPGPPPAPHL
jgi:hypothetical protein